jgi:ectoine hydroxylase-related dioxygenase (phytanoyl-CoA dioxygenase family)
MSKAIIPAFSISDNPAEISASLDEAGCAVVHGMFSEEQCAQMRAELDPHLEHALYTDEDQTADFYPAKTKRITGLVARCPAVRELAMHPVTTALCDHHLLPNCEKYNLHVTAGLVVGPGARSQVLHREEDPFDYFPVPRPNLVIASMAALTEFTADNGGTLLAPGSHRWQQGRVAEDSETVSAEMPQGSMLFWLGGTLHGAGANITQDWRHGVILSYSLGWLRQEENQYLNLPDDVLADLSDELKDRIGVTMHGSLGLYDPSVRGSTSQMSLPKNLTS